MATLDESLLTFLKSHAPNNAGAETDAVKASQALYPEVTYTDAEKTELSQWLITASHIASPSEDAAKSAERLSSLNTHLSSRTTLLGAKPSIADIAIYHKLAPVVSKWSAEERTGEQGYHHIVRHVDFVQNSPVFGLKLDDKVNIDPDNVVFKIKPVDAKAEKERKKKEKEAAAASAAASGATPTTLTGDQGQGGQGGQEARAKRTRPRAKQRLLDLPWHQQLWATLQGPLHLVASQKVPRRKRKRRRRRRNSPSPRKPHQSRSPSPPPSSTCA
ncbi:hypothetical protein P3342_010484 [Pyrenophora teres f. teres]|nr:hypothetical protein P3342_010484 [Pyrenophora teres f. teres]